MILGILRILGPRYWSYWKISHLGQHDMQFDSFRSICYTVAQQSILDFNTRSHEGAKNIAWPLSFCQSSYMHRANKMSKAMHIVFEYIARTCASVHIAPINILILNDLFVIYEAVFSHSVQSAHLRGRRCCLWSAEQGDKKNMRHTHKHTTPSRLFDQR